jgi:hypothetical protein
MISLRPPCLLTVQLCVLALTGAQACGPDFYPDTFVRTSRPDLPQQFVKGRLGLLQPGFARADLFVAYRYLNGGTLDNAEQKGWSPTYSVAEEEYGQQEPSRALGDAGTTTPDTPLAHWVRARNGFPDAPAGTIGQEGKVEVQVAGGSHYEDNFLNCSDDAFRNATETLQARSKLWGKDSPYLLDWLHGQDAVFSNCVGDKAEPGSAPSGSPILLVEDRAYQTAAAHFYGQAFPQAAVEFVAISENSSSPWQPLGGYLAARTLIRQAFFARPDAPTPAGYDPALMQSAAKQLRDYLARDPSPQWRRAAEAQLALVRIRLEPEQRARELSVLVGGPEHDANYAQDLQDLLWVTNAKTPDGLRAQPDRWGQIADEAHPGQMRPLTIEEAERAAIARRQEAYESTDGLRDAAPILDWTITLQSLSAAAPGYALRRWRNTHTLPWLLAALVLAPNGAGAPEDLLTAAATVRLESPAWQTVNYHRARLLIAAGRTTEARTVLAELSLKLQQLPLAEREASSVNAVRGLEMLTAPTAAGFFSFAPRAMLFASSEEYSSVRECLEVKKNSARHYNCAAGVEPEQMDADAARVLNQEAPLSVWLSAAESTSLSPQLRSAIAMEGWTRATLLEDRQEAKSFLLLAPEPLREQATQHSPLAPWMTLARNPGLRPYVNAGTQRAYSYDFVESYRDNWCYQPEAFARPPVQAAFLSNAERQAGADEVQRLAAIRSVFVGRQIIREVEANEHDPDGAEALFLILRMIRYGCTEPASMNPDSSLSSAITYTDEAKELLKLKRDAARLLRQHYAASPWTKKAAPFVG